MEKTKAILLGCCLLCLFSTKVHSRPQTLTRLYPIPNIMVYKETSNQQMKSFDTSFEKSQAQTSQSPSTLDEDDLFYDFKNADTLSSIELQDEAADNERTDEVEVFTPNTTFHHPLALGRHIIEWLSSLIGLTYGVYSKLVKAVQKND